MTPALRAAVDAPMGDAPESYVLRLVGGERAALAAAFDGREGHEELFGRLADDDQWTAVEPDGLEEGWVTLDDLDLIGRTAATEARVAAADLARGEGSRGDYLAWSRIESASLTSRLRGPLS